MRLNCLQRPTTLLTHPRSSRVAASFMRRHSQLQMTPRAFEKACSAMESMKRLPQVVVFDLDYTLWPYYCEFMSPKSTPYLYPDALTIIDAIRSKDVKVAAASRTPTPRTAYAFLEKLDMNRRFDSIQLIPASSGWDHDTAQKDTAHFPKIQRETGIAYEEMLFFDDEYPNIQKVSRLGVTSILVEQRSGVDLEVFLEGLRRFEEKKDTTNHS